MRLLHAGSDQYLPGIAAAPWMLLYIYRLPPREVFVLLYLGNVTVVPHFSPLIDDGLQGTSNVWETFYFFVPLPLIHTFQQWDPVQTGLAVCAPWLQQSDETKKTWRKSYRIEFECDWLIQSTVTCSPGNVKVVVCFCFFLLSMKHSCLFSTLILLVARSHQRWKKIWWFF